MNKLIFLLVLLSTLFSTTHSAIALEIKINHSPDIIEKTLKPLWRSIPYQYEIKNLDLTDENLSSSISFNLEEASVQLAQKETPLFKLDIQNQKVRLNWKFQDLKSNIRAKIRFKFSQFGIRITHDEYFLINADSIQNAHSDLSLNYKDQKLNFNILENKNFIFSKINIKPQDGIGRTLRYIFDNIFSKEEVDLYIKDQINIKISDWINKNELIQDIENQVNSLLANSQNQIIDLSALASAFKFKVSDFNLNAKSLRLKLNESALDIYKRHPCANEIENNLKSEVSLKNDFINKVFTNFSLNEKFVDQESIEPLLCFGFKNYQGGHPEGEEASFVFLKKKVRFNYWIKPILTPTLTFSPNKEISLTSKFKIKTKSNKYPKIYLNKDRLLTKVKLNFNIIKDASGLKLSFKDLKLISLTGKIKVKWNRFTPKITLPLKRMRKTLEKKLSQSLKEQFNDLVVLQDEIHINEEISAKLIDYISSKENQKILFTLK